MPVRQHRRTRSRYDLVFYPRPFEHRAATSKMFGKNMADLKFVATEIGGGFGGKTVVYLEPLATLMSEKSGRPVT